MSSTVVYDFQAAISVTAVALLLGWLADIIWRFFDTRRALARLAIGRVIVTSRERTLHRRSLKEVVRAHAYEDVPLEFVKLPVDIDRDTALSFPIPKERAESDLAADLSSSAAAVAASTSGDWVAEMSRGETVADVSVAVRLAPMCSAPGKDGRAESATIWSRAVLFAETEELEHWLSTAVASHHSLMSGHASAPSRMNDAMAASLEALGGLSVKVTFHNGDSTVAAAAAAAASPCHRSSSSAVHLVFKLAKEQVDHMEETEAAGVANPAAPQVAPAHRGSGRVEEATARQKVMPLALVCGYTVRQPSAAAAAHADRGLVLCFSGAVVRSSLSRGSSAADVFAARASTSSPRSIRWELSYVWMPQHQQLYSMTTVVGCPEGPAARPGQATPTPEVSVAEAALHSVAGGSTEDLRHCVVCLSRFKRCLLIPCGHLQICSQCAKRLEHCPLCRAKIDERITVRRLV